MVEEKRPGFFLFKEGDWISCFSQFSGYPLENRFVYMLMGVVSFVGRGHFNKMAIYIRLIMLLIKILLYPFIKCLSSVLGKLRKPIEQDYSCNIVLVTGAAQGIGKALAIEVSPKLQIVCLMFLLIM